MKCQYCDKNYRYNPPFVVAELQAALCEALDEWEYCSGYKGEYLQHKHRDKENIAEIRQKYLEGHYDPSKEE